MIKQVLQIVFVFLIVAAQAAVGGNFVDENGGEQVIETTDSYPVWVVTDSPDLSRAASEVVVENGTTLIHENLAVTEHGYYVEAKDLQVGDVFIGANGELTTLTDTYREEFPGGVTVYNFTVADNHNYLVVGSLEAYENGASVVLVHNANYRDAKGRFTSEAGGESAATIRGRAAHDAFRDNLPEGFQYNKALPSGNRPDAINYTTKEIIELKPNNPKAIAEGKRQLKKYLDELGEGWSGRVENYNP
ncbi:hypothetical protein FACS1894170_04820 [Planctomycetales bacterium]|nr:hypothetical protein FACS1894170_04820 [Planctomycetales bacterium]